MRTPWTDKEKQEYIDWHEKRMKDLAYPEEVIAELRKARKKFLDKIRRAPDA